MPGRIARYTANQGLVDIGHWTLDARRSVKCISDPARDNVSVSTRVAVLLTDVLGPRKIFRGLVLASEDNYCNSTAR